MELLRKLEQTHTADARVRDVMESTNKTEQCFKALLGAVEGLRQEVKAMQSVVQVLQRSSTSPGSSGSPRNPDLDSETGPSA